MYILTLPSLTNSARLLAGKLTVEGGKRIEVLSSPQREPPLVRWGCSHGEYSNDTRYNSRKAIRTCGNKTAFSNFLSMTDISYVEMNSGNPERFPIVVRTVLNGNSGDGIVICKNMNEFLPYRKYQWSYFYNFDYELGVHILGGRIEKLFKKVWNRDTPEPDYPIRNMDKGYGFRRVNPISFKKLHPYVQSIYDEFGIEFCRADIGWDISNRCYRVIEVNTAPSLSNNEDTLGTYFEFLKDRLL